MKAIAKINYNKDLMLWRITWDTGEVLHYEEVTIMCSSQTIIDKGSAYIQVEYEGVKYISSKRLVLI